MLKMFNFQPPDVSLKVDNVKDMLISARMGRCKLSPIDGSADPNIRKVIAQPEKGVLYLILYRDNVPRLRWASRLTGTIKKDDFVFPHEVTFKKVKNDDGKTFIVKNLDMGIKSCLAFWLQNEDDDPNDDLAERFHEQLNDALAERLFQDDPNYGGPAERKMGKLPTEQQETPKASKASGSRPAAQQTDSDEKGTSPASGGQGESSSTGQESTTNQEGESSQGTSQEASSSAGQGSSSGQGAAQQEQPAQQRQGQASQQEDQHMSSGSSTVSQAATLPPTLSSNTSSISQSVPYTPPPNLSPNAPAQESDTEVEDNNPEPGPQGNRDTVDIMATAYSASIMEGALFEASVIDHAVSEAGIADRPASSAALKHPRDVAEDSTTEKAPCEGGSGEQEIRGSEEPSPSKKRGAARSNMPDEPANKRNRQNQEGEQ
ncbi:hypothetical protein L3Y34_002744 [Caenorhabditis briggsae]|uniref:Pru domain-containing protein n=1 Tax=Caenorhabditis briggsae TaxID=6238 RepID=A0AAE9ISY2_CAEBR|nr:hypothetical protein L3Y34_002744 [Caenorhabditis briggsae]